MWAVFGDKLLWIPLVSLPRNDEPRHGVGLRHCTRHKDSFLGVPKQDHRGLDLAHVACASFAQSGTGVVDVLKRTSKQV